MWLSSSYGLAVYFSLFDSKLSPMAYSLTFNLLALLCTLPQGGSVWLIARSLFTFQVCTTRFNNKNKFFGHFVCLVDREGREWALVSGAGATSPLSVQGVELQGLWGCGSCPGHLERTSQVLPQVNFFLLRCRF